MIDYVDTVLVAGGQWYEDAVHPSSCEVPGLTDITEPACGQGIHNAVVWEAVNKVYRQVIDMGAGIRESHPGPEIRKTMLVYQVGSLLVINDPDNSSLEVSSLDGSIIYHDQGKTHRIVDMSGRPEGVYVLKRNTGYQTVYFHK